MLRSRSTRLTVNGLDREVEGSPDRTLLDVLREELGLTGTKYGCGEGQCGACSVLLDGVPTHACLARLGDAEGKVITTIEGLAPPDRLHPVQRAFLNAGAFQCGYCTPGMIIATTALLARDPDPDEATIVDALRGHICRCGTYSRIVAAVRAAARKLRVEGGR